MIKRKKKEYKKKIAKLASLVLASDQELNQMKVSKDLMEDVKILKEFINKSKEELKREIGKLSEAQKVVLVEVFLRQRRPDFIAAIAEKKGGKALNKAIAKAHYLLKIKESETSEKMKPPFLSSFETKGFMSLPATDGTQMICFVRLYLRGTTETLVAQVSDEKGFLFVDFFSFPFGKIKELLKKGEEKLGYPVAEVSPLYIRYAFKEARRITEKKNHPLPPAYIDNISLLDPEAVSFPLHPIYELLKWDKINNIYLEELIAKGAELHKIQGIVKWVPSKDIVLDLLDRMNEITKERVLFVTDTQVEEAIEAMLLNTVDKFFNSKVRLRYERMLKDSAYVYFSKGDEASARILLASAIAMGDKTRRPSEIPFAKEMFKKCIKETREKEEREEESKKLIIVPK
jgi:hypothetical protein